MLQGIRTLVLFPYLFLLFLLSVVSWFRLRLAPCWLFITFIIVLILCPEMVRSGEVLLAGLLINRLPGLKKKGPKQASSENELAWIKHLPVPSIICQLDNYTIIESNTKARQLLGIDAHVSGISLDDFLHKPFRASDWLSAAATGKDGISVGVKSGTDKHFTLRCHCSRISPPPDSLILIQFSSVQPVSTNRVDEFQVLSGAEAAASIHESLSDNPFRILSGILEHLPLGVCVSSPDGGFSWYSSNSVPAMFGLSPSVVNQQPRWWQQGVSTRDLQRLNGFWKYLSEKGEATIELETQSSTNMPFPHRIRWKAIVDCDELGNPLMAFHFFKVLAGAEQEEVWAQEVMDLARDFSGIAFWEWDRARQQVNWSPEFYQMHDLPYTAVPDKTLPFPYMSDETRFDFKLLMETMDEKNLPLTTEYQVKLPDGTIKDFLLVIGVVRKTVLGETEFLSGFIQDKSEIRSLSRAQKTLGEDLMKKSQMLKEFSTAVSHRIRVPIAQMKGILNLVINKTDIPREQQFQILNESAEELDLALHELNQMLNIDKGGIGVPCKMRWQEAWKPVARDAQKQIMQAQASLMVDFSGAREVYAVKEQLQGILGELMNNALKFRDEERPLELYAYTEKADEGVWFHLQDNGIGMDISGREQAPFDLYKKFHAGKSGKGFGLYLAKLWVGLLDGQIYMVSSPNEGTRVSFFIPDLQSSDSHVQPQQPQLSGVTNSEPLQGVRVSSK